MSSAPEDNAEALSVSALDFLPHVLSDSLAISQVLLSRTWSVDLFLPFFHRSIHLTIAHILSFMPPQDEFNYSWFSLLACRPLWARVFGPS